MHAPYALHTTQIAALKPPTIMAWTPSRLCLLPIWFRICCVAGAWEYPLWAFAVFALNGLLTSLGMGPSTPELMVFDDQVGPDTTPKGPLAKIRSLKKLVAYEQVR